MSPLARQVVQTSYEKSGVTLEKYGLAVIDYANSPDERDRRAASQKRIDILLDDWENHLKASFVNWVKPEVYKAVLGASAGHVDLSRNPAKHIWEDLSVLYKSAPKRSTPDAPDEVDKYNTLLDGTAFDCWWSLVELYTQACNEVLIWPEVITRGQAPDERKVIKHRLAAPNSFTLVASPDDPTELEAILFLDEFKDLEGQAHVRYVLFTDEWNASFEEVDDKIQLQGRLTEEDGAANPFGEMTPTLIRLTPLPDRLLNSTSSRDLCDLTIFGGEERQLFNYNRKMTGFKTGAVVGEDTENIPEQLLDPGKILKVTGHNITFQQLDWQVDLLARQESLDNDELRGAASRGINPDLYKRTGSYQSGTSAKLAERGLSERRLRNAPIFQVAEAEYYRKFCIVAKKSGLKDVPDPNTKFNIEHAQLAYPEDPKAQLEVDEKRIALALDSHVSVLERDDPTLENGEAKLQINQNMEDIADVQQMKIKHNIPNNPSTDSASAEQNGLQGPIVRDSKKELAPGGKPSAIPKGAEE